MCNRCTTDPRDDALDASAALGGLARLLSELRPDADVPAGGLARLVGMVHEKLDPAVDSLQGWRPHDWTPPKD